jgi:hypothetical protein
MGSENQTSPSAAQEPDRRQARRPGDLLVCGSELW